MPIERRQDADPWFGRLVVVGGATEVAGTLLGAWIDDRGYLLPGILVLAATQIVFFAMPLIHAVLSGDERHSSANDSSWRAACINTIVVPENDTNEREGR